jgi:RNA polymerase sigma-70 factor (ECF subfamily)
MRPIKVYNSVENERIRNIVAGDTAAFRSLVRDYHPLAYSLAFKTLNDRQDAEEVVQDAFLKIHQALDGFRGEASLKTWVLRIVLRLSLNRRRDRSRSAWQRLGLHQKDVEEKLGSTVEIVSPVLQTPESLCISQETRQLLLKLVDELPDALREVLVLNSLEELSYEEIARILQIPSGTVGSRMHAARKKLLKKLGQSDLL